MIRALAAVLSGSLSLYAQTGDPEAGRKLFQAHCAPCHGIDGSGGRGPNLAVARLKRAPDDTALLDLIRNGIEGTSMDGAWQLSDNELHRIVAYVRSLSHTAANFDADAAERGKAVYAKHGCAGCHIIRGTGRGLGPELTSIGAGRSVAYLKQSIVDPGASVPDGFTLVRVLTRDGRQMEGLRVNEDTFTIQLKDRANGFQSFRKADLASLTLEPGKSLMPAYADQLSPGELIDLVTYLVSLRGER